MRPLKQMVNPVLPHELILEILSHLPVKPLLRFKCVCKSWNSLISDPQFAKLHLHRSSAKTADFTRLRFMFSTIILDSGRRYASSFSVSSLIQNPSPNLAAPQNSLYELKNGVSVADRVFGSCNGLISILSLNEGEFSVRVWNPATGSISQNSTPLFTGTRGFDFDRIDFGFGYDYLTDTYKVVSFYENNPTHVYTLGDNSWRSIQPFPGITDPMQWTQDGVYLTGTLNWVACDELKGHHIVSLDLAKETYAHLSLPYPSAQVICSGQVLGVLRDCLCVSHDYELTHFVVWQMEEFGVEKSWTQLVKVSYQYLQNSGYPEFYSWLIAVCMSEDDDILMMSYDDESQAILYNRRDSRLQRIEIPNSIPRGMKGTSCGTNSKVKNYLESLISPC